MSNLTKAILEGSAVSPTTLMGERVAFAIKHYQNKTSSTAASRKQPKETTPKSAKRWG